MDIIKEKKTKPPPSRAEEKEGIIMAFFDEFSQKARVLASAATEKAKEAADSAKISAAILSEQRELDRNYRAIGEWFVSEFEGEVPDAVADLVTAVNNSRQRIAQLQESRQRTEGGRECPLCGAVSSGKFCPQCGAPMGE